MNIDGIEYVRMDDIAATALLALALALAANAVAWCALCVGCVSHRK